MWITPRLKELVFRSIGRNWGRGWKDAIHEHDTPQTELDLRAVRASVVKVEQNLGLGGVTHPGFLSLLGIIKQVSLTRSF